MWQRKTNIYAEVYAFSQTVNAVSAITGDNSSISCWMCICRSRVSSGSSSCSKGTRLPTCDGSAAWELWLYDE